MLLINPASEQFGGMFARYVPVGIPVAIGNLAAYLKKFGFSVHVADEEIEQITEDNIWKWVRGLPEPYVFGISVLTAQAARAYTLIRLLKRKWPDCKIILGGIHPTALPEESIHEGADFVVRGEGELTLLKLYRAIRFGSPALSEIRGITFMNEKGLIQHNCDAELIADLDDIPIFPYELFEHPKYDMGFITSSRGCPYRCSYCSQRLLTGLTYRYRSPQRIVEELTLLIEKYGQKHIVFYDDNFSFKKRRVVELCDAIAAAGLNRKAGFFIQTRADNMYEDIMPYLKKANFTGVGFGMETAVERLANVIVKGETVEAHKKAIGLSRKWGLNVSLFMIYGLPTESRADRKESLNFVRRMGFQFTKFNNLIPYPGTKLYAELKDSPNIRVESGWSNFNSTLSATRSIFDKTPLPYVPPGTTAWQLKRDIVRANYSFYLSPKTLWDVMRRKQGPGFVMLPARWYFKPREVFTMAKLGIVAMTNFLVTLLPERVGGFLYRTLTGRREDLIPREAGPAQVLPSAIDGTLRKIKIEKKATLLPAPIPSPSF